MTPTKVFDLLAKIDELNIINNDLNSAERLELFKKVSS